MGVSQSISICLEKSYVFIGFFRLGVLRDTCSPHVDRGLRVVAHTTYRLDLTIFLDGGDSRGDIGCIAAPTRTLTLTV